MNFNNYSNSTTTSTSTNGDSSSSSSSTSGHKKQRPSILITTYTSSSSSGCARNNLDAREQRHHTQQEVAAATKSDESTDLFSQRRSRPGNNPATAQLRPLLDLNQIKGPSGSIRGHKDVVRKSLENIKVVALSGQRSFCSNNLASFISAAPTNGAHYNSGGGGSGSGGSSANASLASQQLDEMYRSEYLERLVEDELGVCVAYTTTLSVIRRTYEDSKLMKSILNLNLIRYEERDIYLNQEYKYQLRMRCKSILVPALFVDGQHLGGIRELELMNENGKLPLTLAKFKMLQAPKDVCLCCGNARFIACQSCNGSRKSTIHHFKFNSIALRCIKCDKNDGLIRCPVDPVCLSQDDDTNSNHINETNEPTERKAPSTNKSTTRRGHDDRRNSQSRKLAFFVADLIKKYARHQSYSNTQRKPRYQRLSTQSDQGPLSKNDCPPS